MRIGVPKEIKVQEHRVGLVPASVHELHKQGHEIWIETQAGTGSGFYDEDYRQAGAKVVETADEVFAACELLIKVKEPQAEEICKLKPKHTLFTYLHLAPDPKQTEGLLHSGALCIAYETVEDRHGRLPLLAPMSEVAGRMSIQAGARCLERSQEGRGLLLGGVAGVPAADVLVIGAGVVGSNAVQMAVGLGARVSVLDKNIDTLRRLDQHYGNRIQTLYATGHALEQQLETADLVIGAVLIPGAAAPKLITRALLGTMKNGAAIVDVAVDQGGCCETTRPTTHAQPTFIEAGVVHYCVANMPGAVPRTSSQALNNATLPYILQLAKLGPKAALTANAGLLQGLNICRGDLCCAAVGEAQGVHSITPQAALEKLK